METFDEDEKESGDSTSVISNCAQAFELDETASCNMTNGEVYQPRRREIYRPPQVKDGRLKKGEKLFGRSALGNDYRHFAGMRQYMDDARSVPSTDQWKKFNKPMLENKMSKVADSCAQPTFARPRSVRDLAIQQSSFSRPDDMDLYSSVHDLLEQCTLDKEEDGDEKPINSKPIKFQKISVEALLAPKEEARQTVGEKSSNVQENFSLGRSLEDSIELEGDKGKNKKSVDIEAVAEMVRSGDVQLKGVLRLPKSLVNEVYEKRRLVNGRSAEPERAKIKSSLPSNLNFGELTGIGEAIKTFFKNLDEPITNQKEQFNQIRQNLFDFCKKLLSYKGDWKGRALLEKNLWKDGVHALAEGLRNYSSSQVEEASFADAELIKTVNEASVFYLELLDLYQEHFDVNLTGCSRIIKDDLEAPLVLFKRTDTNSAMKHKYLSCQRFLIALGDLNRYKQQALGHRNLQTAKRYFRQAILLVPDNGSPYYRLACVAFNETNMLDSIYYLVRSLAVECPVESAAELLSHMYTKVVDEMAKIDGEDCNQLCDLARLIGLTSIQSDYKLWLKRMDTNKLYERTLLSLSHLHLMLYKKLELNYFASYAKQALAQLSELYRRPESPVTALQGVQLVIICIFNIHRSVQTHAEAKIVTDFAVRLTLSIFGIFLSIAEKTMDDLCNSQLTKVLPALRIFCQWLTSWNAYQTVLLRPQLDWFNDEWDVKVKWSTLARICNRIKEDKGKGHAARQSKAVYAQEIGGKMAFAHLESKAVTLPEELECASFHGIFPTTPIQRYLDSSGTEVQAAMRLRLSTLLELGKFLISKKVDFFSEDPLKPGYVAKCCVSGSSARSLMTIGKSDEDLSSSSEISSADGSDPSEPGKKGALNNIMKQVKSRRNVLSSSDSANATSKRSMPQYILVDTNSLIDHKEALYELAIPKKVTVLIPIIVYNELVNLRDNSEKSETRMAARKIVKVLNVLSKIPMYKLKAVTNCGTIMDTFRFAANESQCSATNDDAIAMICEKLLEQHDKESVKYNGNAEQPNRPLDLLLLTEDRNLKIKAHTMKLTVLSVPEFLNVLKESPR